jgi:hypothetical protein
MLMCVDAANDIAEFLTSRRVRALQLADAEH